MDIPVRKLARMIFALQAKTQTGGTTSPAEASSAKSKRRPTSAERLAEHRLKSFSSRKIILERSVDLKSENTWGYLEVIKKGHLENTVTGLGGYIPEIVKEFYVALPGETTRGSEVIVSVRSQKFEFSPALIDEYFDVSPLQGDEIEVDATMDEITNEELAYFLTERTREMNNLTTRSLSPCKAAALMVLAAYNWVPSSNKNSVSVDRARHAYKMFHGVQFDIGVMIYNQVLNLGVIQKEGEKKDTRWLIFPCTIYGVLQKQYMLKRKPRENWFMWFLTRRILVLVKSISRIRKKNEKQQRRLRGRPRRKENLHHHQQQHLRLDHLQALLVPKGLIHLDMCHQDSLHGLMEVPDHSSRNHCCSRTTDRC